MVIYGRSRLSTYSNFSDHCSLYSLGPSTSDQVQFFISDWHVLLPHDQRMTSVDLECHLIMNRKCRCLYRSTFYVSHAPMQNFRLPFTYCNSSRPHLVPPRQADAIQTSRFWNFTMCNVLSHKRHSFIGRKVVLIYSRRKFYPRQTVDDLLAPTSWCKHWITVKTVLWFLPKHRLFDFLSKHCSFIFNEAYN